MVLVDRCRGTNKHCLSLDQGLFLWDSPLAPMSLVYCQAEAAV